MGQAAADLITVCAKHRYDPIAVDYAFASGPPTRDNDNGLAVALDDDTIARLKEHAREEGFDCLEGVALSVLEDTLDILEIHRRRAGSSRIQEPVVTPFSRGSTGRIPRHIEDTIRSLDAATGELHAIHTALEICSLAGEVEMDDWIEKQMTSDHRGGPDAWRTRPKLRP